MKTLTKFQINPTNRGLMVLLKYFFYQITSMLMLSGCTQTDYIKLGEWTLPDDAMKPRHYTFNFGEKKLYSTAFILDRVIRDRDRGDDEINVELKLIVSNRGVDGLSVKFGQNPGQTVIIGGTIDSRIKSPDDVRIYISMPRHAPPGEVDVEVQCLGKLNNTKRVRWIAALTHTDGP